jgi:DNA-binding PadR family transcriptional regulator
MSRLPLSPALLAVLQAVATGCRYGFDLIDATGLPSGTVYPALSRLERDGLLDSKWEDHRIAQREKRPPRRYYEMTDVGGRALRAGLAALRARDRIGRTTLLRPLKTRG